MNVTEVYANNVGIKLPEQPVKPYRNFIPIPNGDYVVIESSPELLGLNYDYFNEVVSAFKEQNIIIAQIGSANSPALHGALDFRARFNFSQICYLIEHSKLLISGDTVSSYAANYLNVPTITLFGPTVASVNKPFYSHPKSVFIESPRNGNKASLNLNESPKSINLIKPEEIINSAFKILNIKPSEIINTTYIGSGYPNFIFEVIPQKSYNVQLGTEAFLNIRLDRNFDEEGAEHLLQSFKSAIITDKKFNNNLMNFKNLSKVVYQVNSLKDLDILFVQNLEARNVDYQIVTENELILPDLKLKLFDFKSPSLKKVPEVDVSLVGKKCKSTRILFANNQTYSSYWHYLNNMPELKKMSPFEVPNTFDMTFWEIRDSIYVYETEKFL